MRTGLPALFSIWLVWVFFDRLAAIDLVTTKENVASIGMGTWIIALFFAWVSFMAVSRYDLIISRAMTLDIPRRRAISMCWKATAVSQLVGFGLITGTLIRWLELRSKPQQRQRENGGAGL